MSSNRELTHPKLSICISTLNRAGFIGATLDSILPQLTDDCEVVILDNASSDNTTEVVSGYVHLDPRVRYHRKDTDDGLDRNFDQAIELARGAYCWLMSDDDLFKPNAVNAVLQALRRDLSVVYVNAEFRDFTMSRVLQSRFMDFETDRLYGAWELDRLFLELGDFVRYIAGVIVKRELWRSRDRQLYVGSYFSFIGMVFQARLPRPAYVIADPLISYRFGNVQAWAAEGMEIMLVRWPSLVASLPISESVKRKLPSVQPWRYLHQLVLWRGTGGYSLAKYRLWFRPQLRLLREKILPLSVALLPAVLANLLCVGYLSTRGPQRLRNMQGLYLEALKESPLHFRNWKALKPRTRRARAAEGAATLNIGKER
jgi:abequosyltransferase